MSSEASHPRSPASALPRTHTACSCRPETFRILSSISGAGSARISRSPESQSSPTHPQDAVQILLGDVLTSGSELVQHWERINSCANASSHSEVQILQAMSDAAGKMLVLYEAAVASTLGIWGKGSGRDGDGELRLSLDAPHPLSPPSFGDLRVEEIPHFLIF